MKKVSAKELLESNSPLSLGRSSNGEGEDFDGSCPCCMIHGEGFTVRVHCWRSNCNECEYSGIHVHGELDIDTKIKIANHIRNNNGWSNSTDWNIVVE